MNTAPLAADDDLWLSAAADVSAAIVSERFLEGVDVTPGEAAFVEKTLRQHIPLARRAFVAGHPRHEGACLCRHESIIIVAASCEARLTGACYERLVIGSLEMLKAYLERRS